MLDPVDVCLYILIRTDLTSLSGGKACAQAAHAANQCIYDMQKSESAASMLLAWEGGRGFGTCITLGVDTIDEVHKIIDQLTTIGYHAAVVHDPTYPLRDGRFTHRIPVDTCAYAFGVKHLLEPFLCHLSLIP